MTTEKMYRFLDRCKTQLELIKDGNYQFEVRVNVKDEIQLRLSSSDAELTIYTDWERWDDKPYYFQDCMWAPQIFNGKLEDLNDLTLRSMVEEAENTLSICLSKSN